MSEFTRFLFPHEGHFTLPRPISFASAESFLGDIIAAGNTSKTLEATTPKTIGIGSPYQ